MDKPKQPKLPAVLSLFDLIPLRVGGVETYMSELSAQLELLGWRSVLCFDQLGPEPVMNYLRRSNVSIEVLENPTVMRPKLISRFFSLLRKHRPEILHLHFVSVVSVYPWLAYLAGVRKIFFTDHSSRPEGYVPTRKPFWKRFFIRLLTFPITRFISVSDYGRSCLIETGSFPEHKVSRIYNGVHTKSAAVPGDSAGFREKFKIPSERKIIVQVCWMIPEKGVLDLIEAAALVLKEAPKTQFVLVGEGDSRPAFMRRGRELGIDDHLTWTGMIENPVAEGVFAATDVACQVSRWQEVFGLVIAEAMSAGKPVVGTRVGGIPELVRDQETGLLAEPGNPSDIAAKILQVLRNPTLAAELGHKGRELAQKSFDIEQNVRQLISLYGVATHS